MMQQFSQGDMYVPTKASDMMSDAFVVFASLFCRTSLFYGVLGGKISCPLRGRFAGVLVEYLAEIGGIVVTHKGGHVPQTHIRVLADQLHGTFHAALGQVDVEGGVAVFAEQAAQVSLGDADLCAHMVDADGLAVLLLDEIQCTLVQFLRGHALVGVQVFVEQEGIEACGKVAVVGGTAHQVANVPV